MKIRSGNDVLVELTDYSDDNWALHLNNSSAIIAFSWVSRMDDGGLHLWSNGQTKAFIAEHNTQIGDEIMEKLIEMSGNGPHG